MNKLKTLILDVYKEKTLYGILAFSCFILIAVTLSFTQKPAAIFIAIAAIALILTGQLFRSWKYIFSNKLNALFISWYLVHLFGLLYSTNLHYGFADIQTKLSYLLFPLLVFSAGLSVKQIRIISYAFALGCFIACFICLLKALGWYGYNQDAKHFVYMSYSKFLHPTYFSFYLNFVVIFLLVELRNGLFRFSKTTIILFAVVIVFLLVNITLLNARTATATAYLAVLLFLVNWFYRSKYWLNGTLLCIALFSGLGFLQYQVLHISKNRLQQLTSVINHTTNENEYNSTTVRIHLWRSAWELIKEQPLLGVGTGDIKEELVKKYSKNNFEPGVTFRYSPHNQYIHTTVILGFAGLLLLVACLGIPLVLSFLNKNPLYFYLLFIIILNNITESLMEVEKGIFFFAFFNSLCYLWLVIDKKKIKPA